MDSYERQNGSIIQIINCSLNTNDTDCKTGLIYNYQTMRMISAFGPIIIGLVEIFLFLIIFVFFISGYICCDLVECFR